MLQWIAWSIQDHEMFNKCSNRNGAVDDFCELAYNGVDYGISSVGGGYEANGLN